VTRTALESCATVAARRAERALSARNLRPACAPSPQLAAWGPRDPVPRGRATVAPPTRSRQATSANATVATAGTGGRGGWSARPRPLRLAGRQPPGLRPAGLGSALPRGASVRFASSSCAACQKHRPSVRSSARSSVSTTVPALSRELRDEPPSLAARCDVLGSLSCASSVGTCAALEAGVIGIDCQAA
jgi:hypothetical protein